MIPTLTLAQFNRGIEGLNAAASLGEAVRGFGDTVAFLNLSPATAPYVLAGVSGEHFPSSESLQAFRRNVKRFAAKPVRDFLRTAGNQVSAHEVIPVMHDLKWSRVEDPIRDVVLPAAAPGVPRMHYPKVLLGGLFRFQTGGGLEHVWNQAMYLDSFFNPFLNMVRSNRKFPRSWESAHAIFSAQHQHRKRNGSDVYFVATEAKHVLEYGIRLMQGEQPMAVSNLLRYPAFHFWRVPYFDQLDYDALHVHFQGGHAGPVSERSFWLNRWLVRDTGWLEHQNPDMRLDPSVTQFLYFPGVVLEMEGVGLDFSEFPLLALLECVQRQLIDRNYCPGTVRAKLIPGIRYLAGKPPLTSMKIQLGSDWDFFDPGYYPDHHLLADWKVTLWNPGSEGPIVSLRWFPIGPYNRDLMMARLAANRGTSFPTQRAIQE